MRYCVRSTYKGPGNDSTSAQWLNQSGSAPNLKGARPGLFNSSQYSGYYSMPLWKHTSSSHPPNHKIFTVETENKRSPFTTAAMETSHYVITVISLAHAIFHPMNSILYFLTTTALVFLFSQYLSPTLFLEVPFIGAFILLTNMDPSNSYKLTPF